MADSPPGPLLTVEGASLSYGGRPAVADVDLTLSGGETLALLGPNGAGKTSLMRLIAGRLCPDRGRVRIAGLDPFRERAARARIGWVPQEIALYPRLTVAENLDVFARLCGIARGGRRAAVSRVLDLTGTGDVADRLVGQLSGGYQRRVNIAASLTGSPSVVLLDEPTQGVDLAARSAIHLALARLRTEGAAILVATHDFAEAERLADRAAFMADGRIVREGDLAAMLAQVRAGAPEHEVALLSRPDRGAEAVLRRAGFAPSDTALTWRSAGRPGSGLDGAALLGSLRAQGVPAGEVRVRAPGLEALYLDALHPAGEPMAIPLSYRAAR